MRDFFGLLFVIAFIAGTLFFVLLATLSILNNPIREELFVRATTGEGLICKIRVDKSGVEILSAKRIPSIRYTVSGRLIPAEKE